MNLDASTIIDATTKEIALLQSITEALKKKTPDVPTALAFVNQLEQHIDVLRARNLQLERDVLNLEKQNFQLQKQVEIDDTWRQQLERLEKCTTLHGKWVLRERGTTEPLICPNCVNDKRITFIQYTKHFIEEKTSHFYYCPTCKSNF